MSTRTQSRREEAIEKALLIIYPGHVPDKEWGLVIRKALKVAYDSGLEDGKQFAAERFILPVNRRRRGVA